MPASIVLQGVNDMKFWKTKVLLFMVFSISPAHCQTVGNGTIIAPAAGARESYGINSPPEIGGSASAFPTRHYGRGNNSGIGGSFIGTTSPTSESSPAQAQASYVPAKTVQFHLPKLDSGFNETTSSPALERLTPAMPSMPRSSALNNPIATPSFAGDSNNALERLPSFSRQPSAIDKLQFDQFGK
jgi:hypothetical protein